MTAKIVGLLVLAMVAFTTSAPTSIEMEATTYLHEITPQIEEKLRATFEVIFATFNEDAHDEESTVFDFLHFIVVAGSAEQFFKDVQAKLKSYPYHDFEDPEVKRQFEILIAHDYSVLSEADKEAMDQLTKRFSEIRKAVHFCTYKYTESGEDDCTQTYDNFDWKSSLFYTENEEAIRYYWIEWRKKAGAPFRHDFENFVNLYRQVASLNGYTKPSEMWFREYEDENIFNEIKAVLTELKPFYVQLHAYVRHFILEKRGEEMPFAANAPIPDDLMEKYIIEGYKPFSTQFLPFPYPDNDDYFSKFYDYFASKIEYGDYTTVAEGFFKTMGFDDLPSDFYEKYRVVKTNNTECFPSAVSLLVKDQVGLRYCEQNTLRNYLAEHREMTEIYYHLMAQNQPFAFRDVFWPGFIQAIGYSTLASAASLQHFERLHYLSPDLAMNDEVHLNRLFHVAIQTIFHIPVNYIQDKFRTSALDGDISSDDYNCAFWTMMENIAGIQPPVDRNEHDFDALAKVLTGVDDMRTRKVFSKILGFQFFEGLCKKARSETRLDLCDYAGSIDAGNALKEMMSLGSSKHWKEVMKVVTDTDKLDAAPMIEYFEPLYNWIKAYNEEHNVVVGWEPTHKCQK